MAYYNYANSPYYIQELQSMRDRIDNQMKQYQQQQMQQPVQQPITQNFQLAPTPTNNELESKYVNNIDEVKNTFVMKTGLFTNKDFSTIWVKDVTGKIKTYNTVEVIEMDEKDKEIANLKKQIEDMKGMMQNATEHINSDYDEQIANEKPTRLQTNKRSNAK